MLNVKYFEKQFWDLNEQEKFLEILYGNNHNGFMIRLLKKREIKKFSTLHVRDITSYGRKSDTWVTLNTFNSPSKNANHLREINAIYLDLDCHGKDRLYIRDAVKKTGELLSDAFRDKLLPEPTMITDTGRGLGIFFVLERSIANTKNTKKQRSFYQFCCKELAVLFKEFLGRFPDVLEVDSSVVGDVSRIVRLPMTFNSAAGRNCRLAYVAEDCFGVIKKWNLGDFRPFIRYKEYDEDKKCNEVKKAIRKEKVVFLNAYTKPFLFTRMQKLQRLQELSHGECEHRRELMCFYFYNSAKQVMELDQAINLTETFNKGFKEPLEQRELDNIYRSVDKNTSSIEGAEQHKGYYKISDETICFRLDLSEEEKAETLFGASMKEMNRRKKKMDNQIKKWNRDKDIAEYVQLHPEATYEEIATLKGVSLSTLKRILKKQNVHRYEERKKQEYASVPAKRTEKKSGLISFPKNGKMSLRKTGDAEPNVAKCQNLPECLCGVAYLEQVTTLYRQLVDENSRDKRRYIPGQMTFALLPDGVLSY